MCRASVEHVYSICRACVEHVHSTCRARVQCEHSISEIKYFIEFLLQSCKGAASILYEEGLLVN